MSDLIFGHTWDEIDSAQRGKGFNRAAIKHTPNPTASEADAALLAEHGLKGLEDRQFFGVIDRLKTSGLI